LKNHFPNSYAEINLQTLTDNINEVKKRVSPPKMLAVVKCNGYGHGAVRMAKHIEEDVDQFGVATVDEGIELRMGGIKKPILVFGVPDSRNAAAYGTHNLTATISHKTHFSVLMDGTRYHLNFDTGMGRLGFKPEDAAEVRQLAVLNQRLICSGIYSHHAMADDPGADEVEDQHKKFKTILEKFEEVPLAHMSNTGASVHYDIDRFDMIRSGLTICGYTAGKKQVDWLKPALTWKSKLVQVRKVTKGDSVSYGGSWTAHEDGYLGTIPVGYGDGVPRSISNKLEVLIDGKLYPQVGNVTMDYIMVFLKGDKLSPETEVILMGDDALDASDWAKRAETNVHEILTGISNRVVRSYTDM